MFDRRILLVAGKGGVGRSALSAAIAIQAARRGQKVLVVGMIDWRGLAVHFGVERIGYDPLEVRPGVWAMAIDRAQALDEYLRLQLHAPRVTPLSPLSRGLSVLAETVPGIRDVITMGKVQWERRNRDWDLLGAGTAPQGQLSSYLHAPRVVAGLVPAGRVREQAAWMQGDLEDEAVTGVVMVTLAEELPVTEATEALDTIASEGLAGVAGLFVNRVLPPLRVSAAALKNHPPGPARDAGLLHRSLTEDQREWLQQLPGHHPLPYYLGVLTPGEIAARLADELEEL